MSTIDIARIRAALSDTYPEIQYVASTGSTNTDLLAAHGLASGSVLLADAQEAGKGRLGRAWSSPAGTQVICSVLLLPKSLDNLGTLPLAAGLAVTDAIPETVLKWPNDVLLGGKKLAGILAEAGEAAARVVLGMGINVSLTEAELPVPTATSLLLAGRTVDRTQLAIAVLTALHMRLQQWQEQDPQLMVDYRRVCSSIGQEVRLEAPQGDVTGVVTDVAEDGRINVGGQYYSAGDVIHLRAVEQ